MYTQEEIIVAIAFRGDLIYFFDVNSIHVKNVILGTNKYIEKVSKR